MCNNLLWTRTSSTFSSRYKHAEYAGVSRWWKDTLFLLLFPWQPVLTFLSVIIQVFQACMKWAGTNFQWLEPRSHVSECLEHVGTCRDFLTFQGEVKQSYDSKLPRITGPSSDLLFCFHNFTTIVFPCVRKKEKKKGSIDSDVINCDSPSNLIWFWRGLRLKPRSDQISVLDSVMSAER